MINSITRNRLYRNWITKPRNTPKTANSFASAIENTQKAARAAESSSNTSKMSEFAHEWDFDVRKAGQGGLPTFPIDVIKTIMDDFDGSISLEKISPEMKAELQKRLNNGDGTLSLKGWDLFLSDLVDLGMITNTERFCCNGALRKNGLFVTSKGFDTLWQGDPQKYMEDLCNFRMQYGEYESLDKSAYEHVSQILGKITGSTPNTFPPAQKTTYARPSEPNGNTFYCEGHVVHKFDFNPRSAGNGTYPTFSKNLLDTMRDALDGSVKLSELSEEMKEELQRRLGNVNSSRSFESWDNFLADLVDLGMISNQDRLCCNGTTQEHGAYKTGWGYDLILWEGDPRNYLEELRALEVQSGMNAAQKNSFDRVSKILDGLDQKTTCARSSEPNGNAFYSEPNRNAFYSEPNGNTFYAEMHVVHKFDFNPRSAGNGTYPTFSESLLDTMRDALDGSVKLNELSKEMKEELQKRLERVNSSLNFEYWDNFLADLVDLGMISDQDRLCCNGTTQEHGAYKIGWGYDLILWEGDPRNYLEGLRALKVQSGISTAQKNSLDRVSKILDGLAL